MPLIERSVLFDPEDVDNAASDVLITVPSGNNRVLIGGRVRFTNHTGAGVTIICHAVPSGGSPATTNIAYPTTTIGANSFVDVDVPLIEAGGTFEAQAGAATSITAQCLAGAYYVP